MRKEGRRKGGAGGGGRGEAEAAEAEEEEAATVYPLNLGKAKQLKQISPQNSSNALQD